MIDGLRGREGFTVQRPIKALFTGEIFVTNKTDYVLQIELAPLSNQRVITTRKVDANINASVSGAGVGGAHEVTFEQAPHAEKVQQCVVGPGETLTLESLDSQSYLTVMGPVPASNPLSASHKSFKVVDVALVCRRREYIIEKKHFDYALSVLTL